VTATRPKTPRRLVERPRLTRRLDNCDARAILLLAPAGYGKTTVAVEWLRGRPHAWYRATAASADAAAFATGVAAAAEELLPGVRDAVVSAPDAAGALVDALAHWPAGAWLAIDDYHLAGASTAVEELVGTLIDETPTSVLVTARRRPQWASARRAVHGETCELGAADLAMTLEEAARLLAGRDERRVRELADAAAGWPAVLALAAAVDRIELPRGGSLYRYFADEVLAQEPPHVQQLVLEAAVPAAADGLPGDVAEDLLSRGVLHDVGGRVAFHPLLRDFLRRRLRAEAPARAEELTERAVERAAHDERWAEAFELALELGRDRAADIAARAVDQLVVRGRTETVARWLDACGDAAAQRPPLVLARAALALRRGAFTDAAAAAGALADRLPHDDVHRSRAAYLTAQALHILADKERALDYARLAHDSAPDPQSRAGASLLGVLCAARLERDDVDVFLAELAARADGDAADRLRYAAARLVADVKRGSLAELESEIARVLPLCDGGDWPLLRSHVLACAAYANVLRARYRAARELAARAAAVCDEFRIGFARDVSLLYGALAGVGLRDVRGARAQLRRASRTGHEDPDFHVFARIVELKLTLLAGPPDEAPPLDPAVAARATDAYVAAFDALRGLVALRRGDDRECARLCSAVLDRTRSADAVPYARFALAACGEEDLAGALAAARRDETLDGFVTAYRVRPELLAQAAALAEDTVRALAEEANDRRLARAAGIAVAAPQPHALPPLTPRETEVLGLLRDGLSNREIAARLFISPATAKVHVHHVLEKLDATSRVEAVVRSR
jgi:LuxR family maltose regulon positive regulatory protein